MSLKLSKNLKKKNINLMKIKKISKMEAKFKN